tara:strand:- start:414 stop:1031 length:618 start_codon:yes stop_codon:yes gene_type:complete
MAKETLQKYMNRKLKDKDTTVEKEKKNAGKYKSIGAAQKAGSLYYTNKNGKVMAAVFAGDLKEEKPNRPKSRPPLKKETPSSDRGKSRKLKKRTPPSGRKEDYALARPVKKETPSSDRGKSRTVKRIREPGGVDPMGLAGPKTYKPRSRKGSFDPSKLATPLKSFSFKQWSSMSEAERRKLRLPLKNYPGGKNFRVVQKPMSATK